MGGREHGEGIVPTREPPGMGIGGVRTLPTWTVTVKRYDRLGGVGVAAARVGEAARRVNKAVVVPLENSVVMVCSDGLSIEEETDGRKGCEASNQAGPTPS